VYVPIAVGDLFGLALLSCARPAAAARFSVADAIEMTVFKEQYPLFNAAMFSPDGKYFAVHTERGNLHENVVESTLWVWESAAVRQALRSHAAPARVHSRW